MAEATVSSDKLKVCGAHVDIVTGVIALWTNTPLTQDGAQSSTINFWESRTKQPDGMTPDGVLLWRILLRLFRGMDVLGAGYVGVDNPDHFVLRITPGASTAPMGISPGLNDPNEQVEMGKFGEKFRVLQGLDILADALRRMTGMAPGKPLESRHENFVSFDHHGKQSSWTSEGERVVGAVVRDIIWGFNRALKALSEGNHE
jgi:hypothetical protein